MILKKTVLPAIASLLLVFAAGCKKEVTTYPASTTPGSDKQSSASSAINKKSGTSQQQLQAVNLGLSGEFTILSKSGIDSDVAHLDFDNCFEGWTGPARIRDEKFSLQLTSSLLYLVVYTPQNKDYFCVEPVSHVSNAIHMADPAAHGLRTLQPGERIEASMLLDVTVL